MNRYEILQQMREDMMVIKTDIRDIKEDLSIAKEDVEVIKVKLDMLQRIVYGAVSVILLAVLTAAMKFILAQ